MEIILLGEAGSYRRLIVGEFAFCMCVVFKHNKFNFFWYILNRCFYLSLDIQISPFHLFSLPAGLNQQMRIFAMTALRPELRFSKVNQGVPAGIHNLFNTVYASSGDIQCALDLGEISCFSDIVECTLFCMAEICFFCLFVYMSADTVPCLNTVYTEESGSS